MKDFISIFTDHISDSIKAKEALLKDDTLQTTIITAAQKILSSIQSGGALYLCGNGGSAADAQHIAAELSGRYKLERPAINAEALHVNTSALTAVANDYHFEQVYARLLQAKANKGDVLIAISTSGNSANIIKAVEMGRSLGIYCIALTGSSDSELSKIADLSIQVPSFVTPIIQECHITIGHILCDYIESTIYQC